MKQSGPDDSQDAAFFFSIRRWIPGLERFSIREMEDGGLTTLRMLASTAIIACTLGLMRLIPSLGAAALIIPMWAAAIGCLLGGYHGATRGLIISIVYPIYFSILIAIGTAL